MKDSDATSPQTVWLVTGNGDGSAVRANQFESGNVHGGPAGFVYGDDHQCRLHLHYLRGVANYRDKRQRFFDKFSVSSVRRIAGAGSSVHVHDVLYALDNRDGISQLLVYNNSPGSPQVLPLTGTGQ